MTFLTEAIKRAPGTPSAGLVETLKAANTAEYDHVVALRRLGGRQLTLRFWIPEAAFGAGGVGLFESIETADTLELMGYLTGTTAFAKRGDERAARFLAEGCAVEAEHRAIARFAQTALGGRQQISIDRSFAPWSIQTVAAMIRALEGAGIGFGERGAEPGRVLRLPRRPGGRRRRASTTRGASRCSVQEVTEPTIYEWAGGEEAFERWLNAFYDLVEEDDGAGRPVRRPVSEEHRRNVTLWWCEVMGGPARYTRDHGGYEHMLAKHRGLGITADMRLRFVTLLTARPTSPPCPTTPSSAPR